jgi:hypothetical protein
MNRVIHDPRILRSLVLGFALAACNGAGEGTTDTAEVCRIPEGESPEFVQYIGCSADFEALASEPLDSSLPGARSVKVVQDHADSDALYFQNSVLYQIHYEFVSTHLSGDPLPYVGDLSEFNTTEYYSPERRFNLGAVTYYDGPKIWALEIAPYDSASAKMIETLFRGVAAEAFFGSKLAFHPTSESVAVEAAKLPSDIPIVTTDDLYAGTDYQPLSIGSAMGRLHFAAAATLDTDYVSFQDILVLDEAPNDITVIQGLITEEFQTPLSHVNVLSQNRHTPNMGLRNATTNETLRAFEGKLVELTVSAEAWSVREVTEAEAEEFWDTHKPDPVVLPEMNLDVKELVDIADVTPEPATKDGLRDAIKTAVLAFGGKAAHYSVLARTDDVPIQKAFAIPMYFYDQFMRDNGFYAQVDAMLADSTFATDASVRDEELAAMRAEMMLAPLDAGFQKLLKDKLAADYPNQKMRFRTSTNSEDLDGFPCAGCYESHSGDPADWVDVLDAIRETYASAWLFRTFEERSYYSIDHKSVGMALLVHHNFADEEANGVAVTSNPFVPSGLDPAFYVNVQFGGDVEVVAPPPGVSGDEFLYFFNQPGQPISYLTHSSLIPEGTTVLNTAQVYQLGKALDAIHSRFSPAYGPAAGNTGWYAMDIEFKFDDEADPGNPATLYIKQARPYPGRGDE